MASRSVWDHYIAGKRADLLARIGLSPREVRLLMIQAHEWESPGQFTEKWARVEVGRAQAEHTMGAAEILCVHFALLWAMSPDEREQVISQAREDYRVMQADMTTRVPTAPVSEQPDQRLVRLDSAMKGISFDDPIE